MATATQNNPEIFGNPCLTNNWSKTIQACRDSMKYDKDFIAIDILRTFDISVNMNSVYGDNSHDSLNKNQYTNLCPLDIQTQDAFTVMRASLDAKLLNGEYWEVYSNEFGEAEFVLILKDSSPNTHLCKLPEIRYCIPGAKMDQITDLVIVRGNTPIPEISCGDTEIIVLSKDQPIVENVCELGNIFTKRPFNSAESAITALGAKMEWGMLAESRGGSYVSRSCDLGKFRQYGTIVYPEYDRKQVFKDNISDPIEIGPFQQIIGWLIDIDFGNFTSEELQLYYNVNFTSGATEIPVRLKDSGPLVGSVSAHELENYFPLECDLSVLNMNRACMTPQELLKAHFDAYTQLQGCSNPRQAILQGGGITGYNGGYIVPNMYQYGKIQSCLDFSDANRWGYLGFTEKCGGDPVENIYQSTTQIIATGFPLRSWYYVHSSAGQDQYFFGIQTEHQTIQLTEGEHWVELSEFPGLYTSLGKGAFRYYGLRFKAPPSATYRVTYSNEHTPNTGGSFAAGGGTDMGWQNPFHAYLGMFIRSGIDMQDLSIFYQHVAGNYSAYYFTEGCWNYTPGGYLAGINDGLWTIDEGSLYAKVNVSRPGIQIRTAGKDVRPLLEAISMKVKPIFQNTMQQPVAACGNNFCQIIDPETGLYDNVWCTREELDSDAEKLRDAMTGITLEVNITALFPTDTSLNGYRTAAEECLKVAQNLYNYYNTFRNEPYKGYTYICGPPTNKDEIPRLGKCVSTPHGIRTINTINYNYQDGQSYTLNIEAGPAMFSAQGVGQLYKKQVENVTITGRVEQVLDGALYKVNIPRYGIITAWNAAKWPWEVGDQVQVELYNVPKEA